MPFLKFHRNKNRFPPQDSQGKEALLNPCVSLSLCFRPKGILTSGMSLPYPICKSWVSSQVSVESYQSYLQEGFCPCLPSPAFLLLLTPLQAISLPWGFPALSSDSFPYGKNWTEARSQQWQWRPLQATLSPDLQCRKNRGYLNNAQAGKQLAEEGQR